MYDLPGIADVPDIYYSMIYLRNLRYLLYFNSTKSKDFIV